MNVQDIIHAAADDADDFLAGVSTTAEARPAIREYLKIHHPKLPEPEQEQVVAGVLAILREEGFFESSTGGDGLDDEGIGGGSDDEP